MGEVRENETVSSDKRKKRRKLIIGLLLIFVLASVIFFSYVSDYYEADDEVRRYFDDTEMVKEFFYAVSYSAMMNLHFHQIRGENNHHIAECAFKAFAKALDAATQYEPRISGVWSTKGAL